LLQGHAFANVGDKTYMWYSHWDCEGQFRSQEIGLATLRRDGFGHLSRHNTNAPAHFVTSTVEPRRRAAKLLVNADGLAPDAPLTVELLDEADRPLRGFSGMDAARLTTSGAQLEVVWPKSRSSRLPTAKRFAVKAGFPATREARVYAVSVAE
jgi:hypothetical protein